MLQTYGKRLLLFFVGLMTVLVVLPSTSNGAAAQVAPDVTQKIVATLRGGQVTLNGTGLGADPTYRFVRFEYGSSATTVSPGSPYVSEWDNSHIVMLVPPDVRSGQLVVSVDGKESAAVELQVYAYDPVSIPKTPGTNDLALTLAIAPDHSVWSNSEFHRQLKGLPAPAAYPSVVAVDIPQVDPEGPPPGIFASTLFGDHADRTSVWGEDIAVASDGTVWLTQGGQGYYGEAGQFANSSRVIRYDPSSGQFACINAPFDNSQVIGVLLDPGLPQAGRPPTVWYSEGAISSGNGVGGNAITGVTLTSVSELSNCDFDPYVAPRDADPICTAWPADNCHRRFVLPHANVQPAHLARDAAGDIWFTEVWGNRIERLTPETGETVALPLPPPIAGYISFPWELAFDANGDLWVGEYSDATVLRVRPSLMSTNDCLHLDANNQNPCVEEVYVHPRNTTTNVSPTLHTLSVGVGSQVWFGVEENDADSATPPTGTRIGFVSTAHNNEVVLLPRIPGVTYLGGIFQDSVTHDVWFAQFDDHKIGRLREFRPDADWDGDTVPDETDADDDNDGCTDQRELGSNATQGGRRDPWNVWDFFDVPTGTALQRTGNVSAADIAAVVARFGTRDDIQPSPSGDGVPDPGLPFNRDSDPLSQPHATGYHPAYDRGGTVLGGDPWDLLPANGSVSSSDISAVNAQFGHTCSNPP